MIETVNPIQMADLPTSIFIFGVIVILIILVVIIHQEIKKNKDKKKPKNERF